MRKLTQNLMLRIDNKLVQSLSQFRQDVPDQEGVHVSPAEDVVPRDEHELGRSVARVPGGQRQAELVPDHGVYHRV